MKIKTRTFSMVVKRKDRGCYMGLDIEKFASRPGARRIAVENFSGSMPLEIGMTANHLNCARDSVVYKWNGPTITAILDGIYEA